MPGKVGKATLEEQAKLASQIVSMLDLVIIPAAAGEPVFFGRKRTIGAVFKGARPSTTALSKATIALANTTRRKIVIEMLSGEGVLFTPGAPPVRLGRIDIEELGQRPPARDKPVLLARGFQETSP